MTAPHLTDCRCFACEVAYLTGFAQQLQHEPWYERDADEDDPMCPLCECRKSEHGDDFPCRLDEQD